MLPQSHSHDSFTAGGKKIKIKKINAHKTEPQGRRPAVLSDLSFLSLHSALVTPFHLFSLFSPFRNAVAGRRRGETPRGPEWSETAAVSFSSVRQSRRRSPDPSRAPDPSHTPLFGKYSLKASAHIRTAEAQRSQYAMKNTITTRMKNTQTYKHTNK